ncbi:MAG: hypothetical protein ACLGG0_10475 [Bacteriovoracia bacterium]
MGEIFLSLFLEMQSVRDQIDAYQILNEEDLELEIEASNFPAMNSATSDFDFWASFNEWNCFPVERILVTTTQLNYQGPRDIPSLRIFKFNIQAYYELTPYFKWDATQIINEWYDLIQNEKYVCVFAAQLPRHKHTGDFELWYISRLKTLKGQWLEEDEIEKIFY